MTRFIFILSLLFVSTGAAYAISPLDPKVREAFAQLDAVQAKGGLNGIEQEVIAAAENMGQHPFTLPWLLEKHGQRNPQSLYQLFISDLSVGLSSKLMEKDKMPDAAKSYVMSYAHLKLFQLMATIDAARCTDGSYADVIKALVAKRGANYTRDGTNSLPQNMRAGMTKSALQYEEMLKDRPLNTALCMRGKQQDATGIDDAAWQKKRAAIRDAFTSQAP